MKAQRLIKTLQRAVLCCALGLVFPQLQANELANAGFEDDQSGSYGNNISPRLNVAPWISLGRHNVVQVDGVGGLSWYGSSGPEVDASSSTGARHYLDMQNSAGSVYQSFTTANDCSGEVLFGGNFSTRGNAGGNAHIEIREGVGELGSLIGTTVVVNIPAGNSETDPWLAVNFSAILSASTTYSFLVWMDDQMNFDEAYVNFTSGPCEDNPVINPPDPGVCLEVLQQLSCTDAGWQVTLSHDPASLLQPDQYNVTSITSGVTISGSSPNFILNGALPDNSAVNLLVFGTEINQGSGAGMDLCCEETMIHVDIPSSECETICDANEELVEGVCVAIEEPEPSNERLADANKNCIMVNGELDCALNLNNQPVEPKQQLILTKSSATHCRAGAACHFSIGLENRSDQAFNGPAILVDQPSKMFGNVRGASNGWQCYKAKNSYQCFNPALQIAANSSSKFTLSLSVPRKLSGKVNNCIAAVGPEGLENPVYLLQSLLKSAGFNPRGVDGRVGAGTRSAMQKYATANHLEQVNIDALLAHLQANFPRLETNRACTRLSIDKPKPRLQCKAGSVYEKGVCVSLQVNSQRCADNANWTGKQCVVCEQGSHWNEQRKSCDFPQVSLSCKQGEQRKGDQCVKIKKPQCIPFITHYSERLGICLPNISIGIGLGGGSDSEDPDPVKDHP